MEELDEKAVVKELTDLGIDEYFDPPFVAENICEKFGTRKVSVEDIGIVMCDHLQDKGYGTVGYCETCGKKAQAIHDLIYNQKFGKVKGE